MKCYSHPVLREVALADVMQALSDPCRIAILRALAERGEIELEVSKATRSHHFDVLRAAGLIYTRTEGTKCMTSIRETELNKRFPGLLKLVLSAK